MEQHGESPEPNLEPNLEPKLERAEATLEVALREACAANVRAADTGELIRIDEMLAIAGEAAKEVISVRRRISKDRHARDRSHHREFEDDDGIRWTAFAVYPAPSADGRQRIPGAFQEGWLSFDSGGETRRLTPIPTDWLDLPDETLRGLCARAQPAVRRSMKRV